MAVTLFHRERIIIKNKVVIENEVADDEEVIKEIPQEIVNAKLRGKMYGRRTVNRK